MVWSEQKYNVHNAKKQKHSSIEVMDHFDKFGSFIVGPLSMTITMAKQKSHVYIYDYFKYLYQYRIASVIWNISNLKYVFFYAFPVKIPMN